MLIPTRGSRRSIITSISIDVHYKVGCDRPRAPYSLKCEIQIISKPYSIFPIDAVNVYRWVERVGNREEPSQGGDEVRQNYAIIALCLIIVFLPRLSWIKFTIGANYLFGRGKKQKRITILPPSRRRHRCQFPWVSCQVSWARASRLQL